MTSDSFKQAVFHKVQERLPELGDALVTEAVDRAEEYFLSRTKRKAVPTSAFYLWIDLALRMNRLAVGTEAATGKVTSIKRGDTTVQYSESDNGGDAADLESRILSYRVVRCR